MGLFSKKDKNKVRGGEVPMLPRLPSLPDLPEMEPSKVSDSFGMSIHQLPSFPLNSLGTKFSQDTIKDAVSGEKRGGEFYADDFSDDEIRMMREPLRRPVTEEMEIEGREEMEDFPEMPRAGGRRLDSFREEAEPVFVRIDRFEEGLKLFESVKDQISAIERMLSETKRIKEKEDAELHSWEDELKRMRKEVEKIGSTIFSKI